MLGTKTIGRSLVFGLGYLAGTRAGRDRYDQIQRAGAQLGRPASARSWTPRPTSRRRPSPARRAGLGRQRHQARAAVSGGARQHPRRSAAAPARRSCASTATIVLLDDDRLGHAGHERACRCATGTS